MNRGLVDQCQAQFRAATSHPRTQRVSWLHAVENMQSVAQWHAEAVNRGRYTGRCLVDVTAPVAYVVAKYVFSYNAAASQKILLIIFQWIHNWEF